MIWIFSKKKRDQSSKRLEAAEKMAEQSAIDRAKAAEKLKCALQKTDVLTRLLEQKGGEA